MQLLLLLSLAACGLAARHPALPPMLLGRPFGGFLNNPNDLHDEGPYQIDAGTTVIAGNFTQPIDNFDANNKATYQQRYWYNPTFSSNSSIVFLLIQGESIAPVDWVADPRRTYQKLAKLYGADIFQLEHRCFGFSRPYANMAFANLTTCNIEQALADIHNFIQAMNNQHNFVNPKWVTFGGSYPGALSALFRMMYPSDTVGAVASSAPMTWTLDYFQYAQVVQNVLYETDPMCGAAVDSAFKQMQQLSLTLAGRNQLNTKFNLAPGFNANTTQLDVDNFFANVYSYYQGVIQYTYDGRSNSTMNGLGARTLCSKMTDQTVTDLIARVNNVINWVKMWNGDTSTTFQNSYSDMMTQLKNVTFDDQDPNQDQAAARGWMWLCCNQLGVLQTTDQGRNVFQQSVTLNYYIDMCTQMFDPSVDIKYISKRNTALFNRYGGADGYKATNVVLPNGSYDPWHVLGVYKNDTASHMTSILIPGAAHCSDMYMSYPNEPAGLANARALINQEVAYFIGAQVKPFPQ